MLSTLLDSDLSLIFLHFWGSGRALMVYAPLKIAEIYVRINQLEKEELISMKFWRRGKIVLLCLAVLALAGCGSKTPLNPKNPVSLTVWHYYNGSQQAAFDSLVE